MSGQAAARGFHFQYLVTVSYLLDMVEDSIEFDTMYVEKAGSPDAANDHAVDFAMSGGMQGKTLIAQIKSIEEPGHGPKFSPNDVLEILLKLVRSSQSDHYELITMLTTISITYPVDVIGLLRRIDGLKSKIPESASAALSASILRITSLISKGGADALAIQLDTRELAGEIPLLQRIELLGLRAEALTYSLQYSRALTDLETLDELAQPPLDLFPDEVLEKMNNIGIAMHSMNLQDDAGDALALFEYILSAAEVRLQRAQPDHHRMHYVLRGVLAVAQNDPADPKSALRSIEGFGKPTSYGVLKDSVFEHIEPMLRQLAQDDPHPANGRSAYVSPLMIPGPSESVESCSKKPDQRDTDDHRVERSTTERTKRFSLKNWIRPGRFRRKTS